MLSFEQCFILFCSFPLLFVFVVWGLGFELSVFVAGWRHALRSEWPFIIIIIIIIKPGDYSATNNLDQYCVILRMDLAWFFCMQVPRSRVNAY